MCVQVFVQCTSKAKINVFWKIFSLCWLVRGPLHLRKIQKTLIWAHCEFFRAKFSFKLLLKSNILCVLKNIWSMENFFVPGSFYFKSLTYVPVPYVKKMFLFYGIWIGKYFLSVMQFSKIGKIVLKSTFFIKK